MKRLTCLILVMFPLLLHAQTETFDVVTYHTPKGWKKETTDFAVSFVKVNNMAGTWCRMVVYKSIASSGDAASDFDREWKAIVKPETYAGVVQPVPTSTNIDGWIQNVGQSKFRFDGKDGDMIFYTISGFGIETTIMVSMSSQEFFQEVSDFITTLSLRKPAPAPTSSPDPVTQVNATGNAPVSTPGITVTDAPGISGIQVSTTNFNDGWIAQPFADYVKVTKASITVLLHYAVSIDDEMRQANNMAEYFWNRMIAPRYRATSIRLFQNEPYTYNKIYFAEGEAVELSTGQKRYVGLRVLVFNGVARCVEIVAPNAAELQKQFPDQDKIAAMTGYNKFMVSAGDIIGTWDESSSTAVQMYNTVTGNYAGMNMSASANSFSFGTDANYNSSHKGAFGMTGSTTFYDQKYNGKYTLSGWEVTMTNRFKGKTDVYYLEYEAVRGGRVLHLTDKDASAMKYNLVKVK